MDEKENFSVSKSKATVLDEELPVQSAVKLNVPMNTSSKSAPSESKFLENWTQADQNRKKAFERMEKLSADLSNYLKQKKTPFVFQGNQSQRNLMNSTSKLSARTLGSTSSHNKAPSEANLSKLSLRKDSNQMQDEGSQSRAFSDSKRKSANLAEVQQDIELVSQQINIYQPKLIKNCTMKEHQIWGLNWLIDLHTLNSNGILADQMGLGKTLQTISFLAYLKEIEKVSGPHLVICPLTVTVNWFREISKFFPSCKTMILPAVMGEREPAIKKMQTGNYNVIIASYESLYTNLSSLRKFHFEMFIVDEAHRLKNDESMFFENCNKIRAKGKLLLTGTPLSNQINELFSLLSFVMPSIFVDRSSFETLFAMGAIGESSGSTDRAKIQEEMIGKLHKIIEPFMLRRLKQDTTLNLPEKKELFLYCPLSTMQGLLYKSLLMKSHKELGLSKTRNVVMDMRKAAIHPYLFPEMDTETEEIGEHLVKNSGKFAVLDLLIKKLVIENKEKVLIFSQFKIALDVMEDYMTLRKLSFFRLDGGTNIDERNQFMDDFNSAQKVTRIFLLSTRAGGLGINLVASRYVIFLDSDWNPQMDMQAMDRVHRIGQTRPVTVFRLVTKNTIEERIMEAQKIKIKLDYLVVERGRQMNRTEGAEFSLDKLSDKEIQDLAHFGASNVLNMENEDLEKLDIDKILRDAEEAHEKNQEFQKDKLKEFGEKAAHFDKTLDMKLLIGADDEQFDEQRRKDADAIRKAILEGIEEKKKGRGDPAALSVRDRMAVAKKSKRFIAKTLQLPQCWMLGKEIENKLIELDLKKQKYDYHLDTETIEQLPENDHWSGQDQLKFDNLMKFAIKTFDRAEYDQFIKGVKNCGRHRLSAIQKIYLPDKTVEEVFKYAEVFWQTAVPRCPALLQELILAEADLFAGELVDRMYVELFGYQESPEHIYIQPELLKRLGGKKKSEAVIFETELIAWILHNYALICKRELERTDSIGDWMRLKQTRFQELNFKCRSNPDLKILLLNYNLNEARGGFMHYKVQHYTTTLLSYYELEIPKCKSVEDIETSWLGPYHFAQQHKKFQNCLLNFASTDLNISKANNQSKGGNISAETTFSKRIGSMKASGNTMADLLQLIKIQIACKGDVFTKMNTAEAIKKNMLTVSGLDILCEEKGFKLKKRQAPRRKKPSQGNGSEKSIRSSESNMSIEFFDSISVFEAGGEETAQTETEVENLESNQPNKMDIEQSQPTGSQKPKERRNSIQNSETQRGTGRARGKQNSSSSLEQWFTPINTTESVIPSIQRDSENLGVVGDIDQPEDHILDQEISGGPRRSGKEPKRKEKQGSN